MNSGSFQFFDLLALIGPLALIVLLAVIAYLSERLGEALPSRKRYRWLVLAAGIALAALVIQIGTLIGLIGSDSASLSYTMIMALALTIAVPVAWGYWGWLLNEGQRANKPGHKDVE